MDFRVRRLDHVVLRVSSVTAALGFYCDVLGLRVERRLDALGLVQLRAGDSLIDVVDVDSPLGRAGGPAPDKGGRNVDHVALRIDPFEPESLRAWLLEHGIEAGEVGERYGAEGSGPSLYVRDPDGNVIELKGPATSPPQRAERNASGSEDLAIDTDPSPADIERLETGLYEFNVERTGVRGELLSIWVRDDAGNVAAGLFGWTWGGTCEVNKLWLAREQRGRGLGRRMMQAAEREARRRGCFQMVLSTHSFQAPDFYRGLGFEMMNTVADYPRGYAHHSMRKALT